MKKEERTDNRYRCCLCGKNKTGYGNNPAPLVEYGRCCDECNERLVIPARIVLARGGVGWRKK